MILLLKNNILKMGASSSITINNEEYNNNKELGQGGFGRVIKVTRSSNN